MSEADNLEAVRLPESDVYHLCREDGPVCNMDNGKFNVEDSQFAEIEQAEQFFRRCQQCDSAWHEDAGMTTHELRASIRDAVDLDSDKGTTFSGAELVKIHSVVSD